MTKPNEEDYIQWYAQNRGLYKKLSQKINNIISELLEENKIPSHERVNMAFKSQAIYIKDSYVYHYYLPLK